LEILNANIGGLYLWSWLLIFVVVFALYYFINEWWLTRSAVNKCSKKMLCLFHTEAGTAYWKWCPYEEGALLPPDMKGYDDRAKRLSKGAIGKIEAAKQAFGWYFILPDHVHQIPYPFEKPKTSASLIEYVENYPAPRVTANIQKWDAEEYGMVTSQMAQASKDTTDIKAIISQAAGIEEALSNLMDMPNDVRMTKYLVMGSLGAGVITGFLVFQVMQLVSKLAALSGISWIDAVIKVVGG
jgi:hypothetical protein